MSLDPERAQTGPKRGPRPRREASPPASEAGQEAVLPSPAGGLELAQLASTLQRMDTAMRSQMILRMQEEQGNSAVRRMLAQTGSGVERAGEVIQRQDGAQSVSTPPLPSSPTSAPERVSTPYGEFDVYGDDAEISLAPAGRSAAVIPIKRTPFNRLKVAIDSISGGGAGISIVGTAAFKASALSDVAWLCSQGVGISLVEAIVGTGKNLTIQATGGGNTTSYNPDADSWPKADGTPGSGCNVTINYNTTEVNPYGGAEVWMTRPPAIGLAHEMVHAWTGMNGTRAPGETGGVRNRELQATGLGAYADAVISENRFRAAFGLPERPRY